MDVEFEHGSHDPQTDVTHDDPIVTGKIALAHMKEFPDYYERLERMESEAERDWAGKLPPSTLSQFSRAPRPPRPSPRLDDVAFGEQDRLQCDAPLRRSAQQELEVHAEVLELLGLSVLHDRLRLSVGLERDPLLVPADRLGLLGQRRDHPSERPRLGAQLLGRLVVLVEAHLASFFAVRAL